MYQFIFRRRQCASPRMVATGFTEETSPASRHHGRFTTFVGAFLPHLYHCFRRHSLLSNSYIPTALTDSRKKFRNIRVHGSGQSFRSRVYGSWHAGSYFTSYSSLSHVNTLFAVWCRSTFLRVQQHCVVDRSSKPAYVHWHSSFSNVIRRQSQPSRPEYLHILPWMSTRTVRHRLSS